ncbi:MAG TPA: hypothetical protein VG370_18665 [Chloroflexota bacterium]|jgi:hypothetical protein|nr:hypothetical protein [Chloroflexota bacterium]
MESTQSGLLERLRAQRESMQAAAAQAAGFPPPLEEEPLGAAGPAGGPPTVGVPAGPPAAEASAAVRDQAARIVKVESEGEVLRQRLDAAELGLRQELSELRSDLPQLVASEVGRHAAATDEALADVIGRVGRLESEFSQERDRWTNLVTSFDHRLDHRLRSFRQDVTVMLAGMAVLVLAMLLLILMRR